MMEGVEAVVFDRDCDCRCGVVWMWMLLCRGGRAGEVRRLVGAS
jgi:hypothetical protein